MHLKKRIVNDGNKNERIMFKDFVGVTLKEGDIVAAIRPNYRELVQGQIISFTPKKVRVKYKLHYGCSYDIHLYEASDLIAISTSVK